MGGNANIQKLEDKEVTFWDKVIAKYLKPLEKDEEKEKMVAQGLKELRDTWVVTLLMCNGVVVLLLMLLQGQKELLSIKWYWTACQIIIELEKWDKITKTIYFRNECLNLEPIGLFFFFAFLGITLFQVIGMLTHRMMTLGHIVSSTKIRSTLSGKKGVVDAKALLDLHGVSIVKDMIKSIKVN